MEQRIEKLKEYLLQNPGDAFLQHALGLEYVKLGEEEKAADFFRDILVKQPDYVGTYYHLARLYERVGEAGKALPVYEKGMEVAKRLQNNHAYNELMMARDDNDEYEF